MLFKIPPQFMRWAWLNTWGPATTGEWKEMGAPIIGGCCATGPEHIMAMRAVVKDDAVILS